MISNNGHAPEQPPAYEPRGVILVDANVLYNLRASIGGEIKNGIPLNKGPRRYLDLLSYLGEQGYEIMIPEMVSYEAGNVLSSGNDVDSFFPGKDVERNKAYHADLKRFLRDVACGRRYPHIHILPSSEPEDVASFLDAIHDVVDYNDKPSPRITKRLMTLQQKNLRHFGDKAIASLLQCEDGVRSLSKHFYVLSDDHDVMANAASYPGVNVLNTMGLINGFIKSGLWEGFGLDSGLDAQEVMRDIDAQRRLLMGRDSEGHTLLMDSASRDFKPRMQHNEQSDTGSSPFLEAMEELCRETGWKHRLETMHTLPQELQMSNVEKFLRRYGTSWKQRHADRHDISQKEEGPAL